MVCCWPEDFSSGGKNDRHPESRPISNTANYVNFLRWATVCAQHCVKSCKGQLNAHALSAHHCTPGALQMCLIIPPTTVGYHYTHS